MLNVFAQRSDPYPDSRHTRAGAGGWGRALTFTWGHDPAAAGRRRLRRFPSRRGPRWTESLPPWSQVDGIPPAVVPGGRNPGPTSSAPTAVLTTGPPPNPRPTCGHARGAGTVVLALSGGRRALFAVPSGDDGHHRLPLVIGLPGYGRT